MAATKSKATATATAITSEKKKPMFVKVETLKPASTAATKSTATTSEKQKKPVFVKVETLKPASTAATKSTVKVVESNPVKATGGGGGRGGRLSVNLRPPARISECLIGDETTLSSSLLVMNKMYAREPVTPFVSTAEMVKKFQSNIREMSLPPMSNSTHKLILTRPKQPEFAIAKRVRPTRV